MSNVEYPSDFVGPIPSGSASESSGAGFDWGGLVKTAVQTYGQVQTAKAQASAMRANPYAAPYYATAPGYVPPPRYPTGYSASGYPASYPAEYYAGAETSNWIWYAAAGLAVVGLIFAMRRR